MVVRGGAEMREEHGLGRSWLLAGGQTCGEAASGRCLVLNTSIDRDRLVGASEGTR